MFFVGQRTIFFFKNEDCYVSVSQAINKIVRIDYYCGLRCLRESDIPSWATQKRVIPPGRVDHL